MSLLSMLFLMVACTALQSLLPAMMWTGLVTFPVLAALVIYYALQRGPVVMLTVALTAGLFQDSLGLMPLGYSSFGFAAGAVIIARYRDLMMIQSPATHMLLTGLMHAAVTAFTSIMLLNNELIPWQPGWLLLKIPGAMVLGVVTGPLVIGAAQALEEKLGIIQGNHDTYERQYSFYGIG